MTSAVKDIDGRFVAKCGSETVASGLMGRGGGRQRCQRGYQRRLDLRMVYNVSSVGMSMRQVTSLAVPESVETHASSMPMRSWPGVGIPVPFGLFFTFQGTLYLGHYFGCLKRTYTEIPKS